MEQRDAYKFCPRCASPFDKRSEHLSCPSCGLAYYLNPKPVQSVILKNDNGELLFVVRSVEPRKGYLDFPGGFVEEDEDFERSARRELKEELGIEVGELVYLSNHKDEYLYQELNYRTLGITFLGKIAAGVEFRPADDVSGVEFYKIEDIPIERLAWPSMLEMLKVLKTKAIPGF